jgi:hypothetical protein
MSSPTGSLGRRVSRTFWVETLGCPKNQVDSDKLVGTMLADGLVPADAPDRADLVVVNTCAFIDEARRESIDVILDLSDRKPAAAELVVTGCLAERYGDELAEALPEADAVAPFGVPVTLGRTRRDERDAPGPTPSSRSSPRSTAWPPRESTRSCSWRRTWRRSAATRVGASGGSFPWWARSPSASSGSGCSTSTRPT